MYEVDHSHLFPSVLENGQVFFVWVYKLGQTAQNFTHELIGHELSLQILLKKFHRNLDPFLNDTQFKKLLLEKRVWKRANYESTSFNHFIRISKTLFEMISKIVGLLVQNDGHEKIEEYIKKMRMPLDS